MRHLPLFFFYFSLGTVFQFPQVALRMHMIDHLNVSPASLTGLYGIVSFPWFAKPLYAFFSDSFPLCGYHKRPYVVLGSLLCSCVWFTMMYSHDSVLSIVSLLTASSFTLCVCDVIVDGVMVQQAQLETKKAKGQLQSLCRAARASGTLFASILGPMTSDAFGMRAVCMVTALFPLANSITCLLLKEPPSKKERTLARSSASSLCKAFKTRSALRMGLFVFATSLTPGYYMSLTFYLQTNRNFSSITFGELDVVYSFSVIAGSLLFSKFFRKYSPKSLILGCILTSFCLRMLQILLVFGINKDMGIPDEWFVALESVAFSAVGTIANMPIAILCASMAPVGLEATFYATMMSLSNIGGGLSSLLSSGLTLLLGIQREHFESLWKLIVICNMIGLLPLFMLRLLPSRTRVVPSESESEEKVDILPKQEVAHRDTESAHLVAECEDCL